MTNSKLNVLTNFFYNEVESDKMKKKFFGWENYENLFSQGDCFNEISKVLDVFHDYWDSVIGVRHSLLIEALIAKVVDVSAVYDGISISFERKIKLNEDKTKVLFA